MVDVDGFPKVRHAAADLGWRVVLAAGGYRDGGHGAAALARLLASHFRNIAPSSPESARSVMTRSSLCVLTYALEPGCCRPPRPSRRTHAGFAQERAAVLVVVDHENREPGEVEDLPSRHKSVPRRKLRGYVDLRGSRIIPDVRYGGASHGVATMVDTEITSSVELS